MQQMHILQQFLNKIGLYDSKDKETSFIQRNLQQTSSFGEYIPSFAAYRTISSHMIPL
jgi:hypothetical protein